MAFPEKKESILNTSGNVEFENVFFNYGNSSGKFRGEALLKDITFSCRQGETTGIIGSTGSGKTILVNLIPRFYDINSGSLKLGGADIKSFAPEILRKKISLVPQKTVLFTGTIMENIIWGKDDATSEEVVAAAKASCAHEFISDFPEGYETILGQGGVNLSGGQKQRIAIARALIRRPDILILDDCTSAVDVMTENRIRKSLGELYDNPTLIIISQRITSIANADMILVMDDGRIAGSGKHADLMKSCKIYREIFRSQIGDEGLPNG
jgi:ATP-binding cassette subfamily B protein